MSLEKKDWAIILLAVLAVASIIGNGVLLLQPEEVIRPDLGVTIVMGTSRGPVDLDPQYCWDSASADVIEQVIEGLFTYNLSDPDLGLIPSLALWGGWDDTANTDGTYNYTVILREGVYFHDGTKFNASSVKWNFDRLLNLMDLGVTQIAELYQYYVETVVDNATADPVTYKDIIKPLINDTVVLDEYVFQFKMNVLYGPFQALLCFTASGIMSPTSHADDFDDLLETATSDLVGTGPFIYDKTETGVEVIMHAFDYYWGGRAQCDTLIYSIITDAQIRNNALLSGDIDFLNDPMGAMYDTINTTAGLDLVNAGQSLISQYLGMNNVKINATFRRAISHAINYSYILKNLMEGQAARLESPIPEGFQMSDWSHDEALYDVVKAREIMQSMGYGTTLATDTSAATNALWEAKTFRTFNYTYNIGNNMRENVYQLLIDNLGKIGIKVNDDGDTWANYIYRLYEIYGYDRNDLELYWIGWIPDYNDPSNFINPLFTNRTVASNGAQYNGYLAAQETDYEKAYRNPMVEDNNVQLLMEAALFETDEGTRADYYSRIQELLVEEDMPWVYGYVSIGFDAHNSELKGFPTNPWGKAYFYPCYWDPLPIDDY